MIIAPDITREDAALEFIEGEGEGEAEVEMIPSVLVGDAAVGELASLIVVDAMMAMVSEFVKEFVKAVGVTDGSAMAELGIKVDAPAPVVAIEGVVMPVGLYNGIAVVAPPSMVAVNAELAIFEVTKTS